MADIKYFEVLKKSWRDVKANPVLVVPPILASVFSGVVVLALMLIIGMGVGLSALTGGYADPISIIIASVVIFVTVVVLLFVLLYFRAMSMGMLKEVVDKGKTSTANMWFYGKKYFKPVLGVTFIVLLIVWVPVLIFGLLAFLSYQLNVFLAIFFGVFAFLILMAFGLIATFGLFFIDPIIVSENKSSWQLIKFSLRYAKKNLGKVFITWGVTLIFSLAIMMTYSIAVLVLSLPFFIIAMISPEMQILQLVINSFFRIVQIIINLIVSLVISMFIFNVYFSGNKVKKMKKK